MGDCGSILYMDHFIIFYVELMEMLCINYDKISIKYVCMMYGLWLYYESIVYIFTIFDLNDVLI